MFIFYNNITRIVSNVHLRGRNAPVRNVQTETSGVACHQFAVMHCGCTNTTRLTYCTNRSLGLLFKDLQ